MAVLDGQPAATDADDPVGCRARQGHPGAARERRPAGGGAAGARLGRARPALGPPGSRHDQRARRRRRGPAPGTGHLPHRGRQRVGGRGRPLGGRRPPRPLVPAVPLPPRGGDAHLPDRPDPRGRSRPRTGSSRPTDLDPVAALEENLGTGWEFDTRVVFDAPLAEVAPWIRPPMGRLEPSGTGACSSAAPAIRPCTRRSGWRACRSPSASRAGRNCGPRCDRLAARFAAAVGPAGCQPVARTAHGRVVGRDDHGRARHAGPHAGEVGAEELLRGSRAWLGQDRLDRAPVDLDGDAGGTGRCDTSDQQVRRRGRDGLDEFKGCHADASHGRQVPRSVSGRDGRQRMNPLAGPPHIGGPQGRLRAESPSDVAVFTGRRTGCLTGRRCGIAVGTRSRLQRGMSWSSADPCRRAGGGGCRRRNDRR